MNKEFLIEITIGPVQGFIDAAARTSDLWQGSKILGDLSLALAGFLKDQGCQLIYPSPAAYQAVFNKTTAVNVTNIILAKADLETAVQAQQLIADAKYALEQHFTIMCKSTLDKYSEFLVEDFHQYIEKFAEQQLEVFGAWAQVTDSNYRRAYAALKGALASRKACRNFAQLNGVFGRTKSSLDGIYDSAINSKLTKKEAATFERMARLRPGEQLDLMGLMKRLGGKSEQFTPLSRIAADPWVQNLERCNPSLLQQICECYEQLVALGEASRVRGNAGAYSAFPYDAQLLFRSRLQELERRYQRQDEPVPAELIRLDGVLRQAIDLIGQPDPYMVLMAADGDHIGGLIDSASTAQQHQSFSDALFEFSKTVADTLRAHRGHTIYAGGDDVLALLPLPQALECAKRLRQDFLNTLRPQAELQATTAPTLSVGLAVVHCLEPLAIARSLSADALKLAKKGDGEIMTNPPRDAIGLLINIRSGRPLRLRLRDVPGAHAQISRVEQFMKLCKAYATNTQLDERAASRLAFEPLEIVRRYGVEHPNFTKRERKRLVDLEMARLLERLQDVDKELKTLVWAMVQQEDWKNYVDHLVAARWLAKRGLQTMEVGRP